MCCSLGEIARNYGVTWGDTDMVTYSFYLVFQKHCTIDNNLWKFDKKSFVKFYFGGMTSKSLWSDLHRSSLSGVMVFFPVIPVNTISKWWVLSVTIEAVQIGGVTVFVPPGPFVKRGTVPGINVIVLIFGWKGETTMIGKRISSSSWRNVTWSDKLGKCHETT